MSLGLKTSRILIPSGAFTASTASRVQQDPDASGVRLYLNITATAGGAGIAVVIRGYDRISGNPVELSTGGTPVNQTGTYAYELSFAPDPAFGNIREATSRSLPYQWDAQVKNFDGLSYTFSLSAETIK